ncbi:11768_t:CDS:2 [Ambispora leptoticha]|uniref:11768_t:CDS:1 n=1 Tax=Ambispora leptoticha TaxID=144679 RepID=A0A9N9HNI2_9GLOM|nr:11768_t:CDS:2 [Ambispora leptoticha]
MSLPNLFLEELGLDKYENNELVQEVAQDLWNFFQSKSCECRMRKTQQCFEKVGFQHFFERHMQFRGLDKKELDLVLIGQLMAFEYNQINEDIGRRFNYQFNNNIKLCKNTYLKLIRIGEFHFTQIKKHFINEGLVERLHVHQFIINYANLHGYPSPGRHLQHDTQSIIYLPTEKDYAKVYTDFIECLNIFLDKLFNKISYASFIRLWKELTPHIKFMSPGTDLYELCETLKIQIQSANYDDEKKLLQKKLYDHKKDAEIEREYYRNNIITSITLSNMAYICYDFAQNVPVPYSPQQIGATYFKSAFQTHIFDICNTGQNLAQQLNYIIGENEFPQGIHKGANTTLNLVYNGLH